MPGFSAFTSLPPDSSLNSTQDDFLPPIPLWAWFLVGAIAVFTRFYKLTALSVWPEYEEGLNGYMALELSHKWSGELFYSSSEIPRGYVWDLNLLFRILGSSLTTLWIFPALVSLLAVPLSYWAARQFFSKSLSFFAVFLMASSFWPSYLARNSIPPNLIPLWGCFVLFTFGKFMNSSTPQKKYGF